MHFPLLNTVLVSSLTLAKRIQDSSSTDINTRPIILSRTGGFQIGGRTITAPPSNTTLPGNQTQPPQTLTCDHGYIEYFLPYRPRLTSLLLWHSSSTQVWQNRWDGGAGFKDLSLRRNYPVYLWDGPRVGRANWACANYTYTVGYRDQGNWAAWNFGPKYGVWWDDVQFPTGDEEAWKMATSARYLEFDDDENVDLQSSAAAVAADSGRLLLQTTESRANGKGKRAAGNAQKNERAGIVYLTNSAGGLRAQLTATKSQTRNIAGIVAYESIGFVFPDTYNTMRFGRPVNGFGPVKVPVTQFRKLAQLTAIQFVWGDHRDRNFSYVEQSYEAARLINEAGGKASVLMLGEVGLKGSTHIPFADLDNERVAGFLDRFLEENGLDGYVEDDDEGEEEQEQDENEEEGKGGKT